VNMGRAILLLGSLALTVSAVELYSPGFPKSHMDAEGRLVEDWGRVGVRLSGKELTSAATFCVEAIQLEQRIPAARAVCDRGPVTMTLTAYRAPIWPSGVDVLLVRVEETKGKPTEVTVGLDLPAKTRIGTRTATLGGRTVVSFPEPNPEEVRCREWGHCDDAVSMRNWGKPSAPCDPAFRNIRAGMGGVPIRYQFTVPQRGAFKVWLGFCESHWPERGGRVLLAQVEGAPSQTVDPVARWGRHRPGVLLFDASDANRDGQLSISVCAAPGAADRNPILNAIWIFPSASAPKPDDILSGKLNAEALYYVDVGGSNDQSLFPNDRVEYHSRLPAKGVREWTFWVACPGGSAPPPASSAWTTETLLRAALSVWDNQ